MDINELDINIADNDGTLRNINEIIEQLVLLYNNFDTRAMSNQTLFLQGKKDMLRSIITYLKIIAM